MKTGDPLGGIAVFLSVVRHMSFTRAAEELALSRPTVSAQIDQLERRLGVRLLHRSTRHLALTEAGRAYHDRLADIPTILGDAERAAQAHQEIPAGKLRLAAPPDLGQSHLTPMIARFLATTPEIEVELILGNETVNLIERKIDLAIRGRIEIDDTLVTRQLGLSPILLCAAPDYLARQGAPVLPEDLGAHRCLHFSGLRWGRSWHLSRGEERRQVPIAPAFEVNDGQSLALAAVVGMGIALLPRFIVGPHLRAGRLVPVLPDWSPGAVPLHAVYPDNRFIARKVKAFVAFLAAEFRREVDLNPDLAAAEGEPA